jgi:hypothetical protein
MKILFSMTHFGYIRNYDSTLRLLASRGHRVHLTFTSGEKLGESVLAERLVRDCPNITYGEPFKRPADLWLDLTRFIRMAIDYVRYLHPRYEKAVKLRDRVADRLPRLVVVILRAALFGRPALIELATRVLLACERALPLSQAIMDRIRSQGANVVLVTPLVELASEQTDYVKCARALGKRTALCVYSWDNLTNKGVIKTAPDMVAVWNEAQRSEAVDLHGIQPDRVVVTGAPAYDHWFQWKPSASKEEFCRKAGLAPDKPFILYTCSSPFIAPEETGFIRKWLAQLRASKDPALREAGVLVRPHPQNTQQWESVSLTEFGNVTIWPRSGINPIDEASRSSYFDSLYHCSAVMGINTTALIEAGIIGRPVYTMTAEDFAGTQTGTLHFHHLVNVDGGLLHVAANFDENLSQLSEALGAKNGLKARRPFIETFIRPRGLDQAAAPLLVEAIEKLAESSPLPAPAQTFRSRMLQAALRFPALLLIGWSLLADRRKENWNKKARMLGKWGSADFLNPPRVAVKYAWDRGLQFLTRRPWFRWFVNSQLMTRIPPETGGWTEAWAVREIKTRMLPLQRLKEPIVVGPWFSEVGFEVLYWVPFIRWLKGRMFSENDLIIVSRGGARPWYRDVSADYVDILEAFSPDEFRAKNESRMKNGKQKQRSVTDLDNEILSFVRKKLSLDKVRLIHPSLMYKMFNPYWKGFVPPSYIQGLTTHRAMPALENAWLANHLPENYTAVKFYFSYAFPDTPDNRRFVAATLERLAEKGPVVLLNTNFSIDDHRDFGNIAKDRIYSINDLMSPTNNLELQTFVVSRAKAFVGTYGGFSYIAPLCGVNALSFYSDPDKFNSHHHELAQRVFSAPGFGSLGLIHTRDAALVDLVFGPAAPKPVRPLHESGSVS